MSKTSIEEVPATVNVPDSVVGSEKEDTIKDLALKSFNKTENPFFEERCFIYAFACGFKEATEIAVKREELRSRLRDEFIDIIMGNIVTGKGQQKLASVNQMLLCVDDLFDSVFADEEKK